MGVLLLRTLRPKRSRPRLQKTQRRYLRRWGLLVWWWKRKDRGREYLPGHRPQEREGRGCGCSLEESLSRRESESRRGEELKQCRCPQRLSGCDEGHHQDDRVAGRQGRHSR